MLAAEFGPGYSHKAAMGFLELALNNHKINFCWEVSIRNFSLNFGKGLAFAFSRLRNQAPKKFTKFHRRNL